MWMGIEYIPTQQKGESSAIFGYLMIGTDPIETVCATSFPSWHGPDYPPVVVIVVERTVRTVLLSTVYWVANFPSKQLSVVLLDVYRGCLYPKSLNILHMTLLSHATSGVTGKTA